MNKSLDFLKQSLENTSVLYLKNSTKSDNVVTNLQHIAKSVLIASNEKEAIQFYHLEPISLIFIELSNKFSSQVNFIKTIKELNRENFVVIVSEVFEQDILLQSIELDVDAYLFLPLKIESLYQVCEKFITQTDYELQKYQCYTEQYLNLFEKTNMISKTNTEGIITYANNNFCTISGYSEKELKGNTHRLLKYEDNPKELYDDLWETIKIKKQPWKGLVKNKSKFDKPFYVKTVVTPIKDIHGNIVEFIAMRDDLSTIIDDKQHLFNQIKYNDFSILVLLQIDEFDMLDKFYNTVTVNQVESNFAFNLISYLPQTYKFNNIYSLGEGRFALLTDFMSFEASSLNLQEYLHEFINNVKHSTLKFDELEFDLNITASYAIGQYMLFEDAKAGLEKAINDKMKLSFSNDLSIAVSKEAKHNLNMIKTVKIALENYNIVSYFQPILNNQSKEIEKYESLVRLIDENGNIISPFHFLNIAKKGNYYNKITERVLENSFKILHKITTELSVNISISDIEKESTRTVIYALLEEYKQDAHRIVFELLEDEDIKDFNVIKSFIHQVKAIGVQIAIDDFGAGYSNFERLLEFEPDILKIDGSLIKNIVNDGYNRNIVETIVLFAKKQNIKTIAEYVENETIFNVLKELGVDYSQGYYFGKPEAL